MSPNNRILLLLMKIRPEHWMRGLHIGQICHIGSWRLYPKLNKLEQDGIIESRYAQGYREYRLKIR